MVNYLYYLYLNFSTLWASLKTAFILASSLPFSALRRIAEVLRDTLYRLLVEQPHAKP
jgi:hypothetical protein